LDFVFNPGRTIPLIKTPLALLIAAAATLGGVVMGSASAARADDLGYFQTQVAPYLQKPKFIAPGAHEGEDDPQHSGFQRQPLHRQH
jgi:hypothetical protein